MTGKDESPFMQVQKQVELCIHRKQQTELEVAFF